MLEFLGSEGGALFMMLLALYMIPSIIAYSRRHQSRMAIVAVNVLLGWSLLGWIVAFVWSLTGNVERQQV
ncbi:MAG: superinfection immunity protein [Pseudomonadales bacterium]